MPTEAHSRQPRVKFVRIPADHWRLGPGIKANRKQRLLRGPTYEKIVTQMIEQCKVAAHYREKAERANGYYRGVLLLQVASKTVDLFHNSAAGYRAQYYAGKSLGVKANRFALKAVVPHAMTLLNARLKWTCPAWWLEKSLLDREGKIWIRQGKWMWQRRYSDRQLYVNRWHAAITALDKESRRKAIWSRLTPRNECHIELKGGFLTLKGRRLGSVKPNRTGNLHSLGFT
jgi:hypothetical protein